MVQGKRVKNGANRYPQGSVEPSFLNRIPARRITAPQPVQPHRNGLPHGNALSVAFERKCSDPFGNLERCACAIALFDSERASPQVLLVSHCEATIAN